MKDIQIATLNGNHYPALHMMLQGEVLIGGSTALVALGELPSTYQPGDVDFCVRECSIPTVTEYLVSLGYVVTKDVPNGPAFTIRKQFKLGEEKVDFFVVPAIESWMCIINGIQYTKPAVIWAARGYYAGVGSEKAQKQLVDNGMIKPFVPNTTPATVLSRKQVIRRIIMDVKHIIKITLRR